MSDSAKKILVVEDEIKIVDAIRVYLENEKFRVFTAYDGETALSLFTQTDPDLVVLDLMLPKISGERICQTIRQVSRIPIIMLTAKSGEDDKISGFSAGADDYLTKPFSPRELLARIKSLLRRCGEGTSPLYCVMNWNEGDLVIDFESRVLKKKGQQLTLTPSEFRILSSLMKYPQKIFTRDELIDIAFGADFDGFERTVDSHIKNLRGKIEDNTAEPRYILTVRGVGYRFGGTRVQRESA